MGGRFPFLVRIAGLETAAVTDLSCRRLDDQLLKLWQQEAALGEARDELVETLFEAVEGSPRALRRTLLKVKRDAFNGRPLARHAQRDDWTSVNGEVARRAEAVLELEKALETSQVEFADLFDQECELQFEQLLTWLDEPALQRGIAVTNRQLAGHLGRLRTRPRDRHGRKELRLERTLLRFLTRAAVKLSPFSTLTRVALGQVEPGSTTFGFVPGTWHERSLVRLKRLLAEQLAEAALRRPQRRATLPIRPSQTLQQTDGRYVFLQPMRFVLAEDRERLECRPDSIGRCKAGGLPQAILEHLRDASATTYGDLRQWLTEDGNAPVPLDGSAAIQVIERYLDAGLLELVSPWPSHTLRLEIELLRWLRQMRDGKGSNPEIEPMAALIGHADSFAEADDPRRSLAALADATVDAWGASEPYIGTKLDRGNLEEEGGVFEDVVLSTGSPEGELLHLPKATADDLCSVGEALWQLVNLFNGRHDFLLSLHGFVARRWGKDARVPFLEVFAESQALWKSFVRFKYDPDTLVFDPFELGSIAELQTHRRDLRARLDAARADAGYLSPEQLFALAADVEPRFRSLVGPCLFVQPTDRHGESWVVNRMFEGTGRYGSRFHAAMDPAMAARMIRRAESAARFFDHRGRPVELLDVLYSRENTANLHPPQTPKVLVAPGERTDLPSHRTLYPRDLWIHAESEQEELLLVDTGGLAYAPCNLSPVNGQFLPVINKYLAVFGPGGVPAQALYGWHTHDEDGIVRAERLTIGRLTVLRRRWVFDSSLLPVCGRDRAEDFRKLNLWRMTQSIPAKTFWIEKTGTTVKDETVYKPQYLDFQSPALVDLFVNSVVREGGPVTLEEALPEPSASPCDTGGKAWAVELMMDTLFSPKRREVTGEATASHSAGELIAR